MSSGPTNILLITSDQHHWSCMGYENPQLKTPNLDRLAGSGTVFSRAYCPNPTCTPTRASIITGRYPSQHGAYSLGTQLNEQALTVGSILSQAGYATSLIGKAHFQQLRGNDAYPSKESYPVLQDLEYWRQFNGPFYGFDHVELARNHTDEAHVGQHYALWMEENGLTDWRRHFSKPTGTSDPQLHRWSLPERFHYDAWIAERSIAQLEARAQDGKPFFLWSSFFDPHPSYLVSEPWDAMYDPATIDVPSVTPEEHELNPPHFRLTQTQAPDFSAWQEPDGNATHGFHSHLVEQHELAKGIAVYYGMISMMDAYIGRILDRLDALGLADSTLVVFTTDHGHLFGQHGLVAKGPFHYEDLLRVPFVVRHPRDPADGSFASHLRRSDALLSLVDLAPTFLSYAGVPVPRIMTGVDQSRVLSGSAERARDHVIVENRHQPSTLSLKTYVDDRYKITVYQGQRYGELFDLQADPGEVRNLWGVPEAQTLKLDLLQRLIDAELCKEPVPMPRVAGA